MGNGVFAARDIPGGTVLGDFIGRLIPIKKEAAYCKKYGAFYAMTYDYNHELLIWPWPDAKALGIHSINHSCMPSCEFVGYQGHTLAVAVRKIFKGEELTIGYNLGRPKPGDPEGAVPCYCETPLCRGTMHVSGDDSAEKPEKPNPRYPDTMLRVGQDIKLLKKYPALWKDKPYFDLYGAYRRAPLVHMAARLPPRKQLRELIRDSGRNIRFFVLGLTVHGVMAKHILAEPF